ncbi:hypothetical protein Bca4012_054976 [Brassica carinata]
MVSLILSQHNLWPPESGSTAFRGLATAASVHACDHLRRHLRLGFHIRSSLQKLQQVSDAARTEFSRSVVLFNRANFLHSRDDDIRSSLSVCFFDGGGESRIDHRGEEGSSSSNQETSKRNTSSGRRWTNVLLAVNVNSLIDRGQLWRLATSSVLHANPMHLMSLLTYKNHLKSSRFSNELLVEQSAISWCVRCNLRIGKSLGTVGSVAVFVMRHKQMVRGGNEDLMQIAQVIALNMIGGLLGGTAMAWLVGPQWKYEYTTRDGRRVFVDRAPIPLLLRWRNEQRRL